MSKKILGNTVYLTNEDYDTLCTTGTVTLASGEVVTYSDADTYIVPEQIATTTSAGLMSSADKTKLDGLSAPSDATITIQKNGATAGTFTLNQASAGTVNIEVPTATSGLTNDSGFITKNVNDLTNYTTTTALNTALGNKVDKININSVLYGTTSTGTQASFGYSDLAISFTIPRRDLNGNINVGTPTTANNATSKQYVDNGLSAKQDTITSSNKLSAGLVSGLSTVATSGSYADLSNKPSIPTKTSDITNDSGFITKNVSDLTNYTPTDNLATVATSGLYSDLTGAPNIINNTSSSSTTDALSANMGKVLNDRISSIEGRGRYLTTWDASTGKPSDLPGGGSSVTEVYTYKTGDYFVVNADGNKFPTGTSISVGTTIETFPSETRSSETAVSNDTIYFNGSAWTLLHTPVQTVTFSSITGQPTDNTNLATALNAKVSGPSSSTDNAIARFNGTGGKTIQNSHVLIDDTTGELSFDYGGQTGSNDYSFRARASGSGKIKLRTGGTSGKYVGLDTNLLSSYQTASFPNKSGTLAMTSDIPDVSSFITKDVNNLTNYTLTSGLATVATSGSYNDLTNKPTNVSSFTNDAGYITNSVSDLTNYTTTANMNTLLAAKENTTNKVTSISNSSTDTQYPSAKAVYDKLPKVKRYI